LRSNPSTRTQSGGITKLAIVGGNVAGTNVAKAVRDAGPAVEIDIFSDEMEPYYARPKLIDFLAGTVDEAGMTFYPKDWYDKNRIRVHLSSRVERLDLAGKTLSVKGVRHAFDKLVIATGATAFLPPLKGLPKQRVFTLRTLEDARRIREAAEKSTHVAVIGGGLLGLETARALTARHKGLRVTILEYAEHLLMRQLDHEGAAMLRTWLEGLGLEVMTKAETEEVLGATAVEGIRLKDGRTVQCDMVVVSAGARPDFALAKEAGLKVGRGLAVDGTLRTSNPDVFAVGDVIELGGKTWGIIPPALEQARIAAKAILGQPAPEYRGTIPSNTLKVAGLDMSSMGTVRSEHETPETGFEEIRSVSPDRKVYRKFVLKDGKLIGAILLGTKKDWPKISKAIAEGRQVEDIKASLADPGFAFP
jgi:nitrite reductase (NADH) large subunit